MDDYFDAKVAIVTGGASGIGRALASALIGRGTTVVLADINEEGARAVAESLAVGARAVGCGLDVTDRGAVAALVASVAETHGKLDFMFNNAGIGVGGPVETIDLSLWERVIDVDLYSVIYGVHAAYPLMVRQGSGHIVNTASMAGLVPAPLLTPYAAAKAGVVGLTQSLRVEAAAYGVRVCAICPGPVETPLLDAGNPDTSGRHSRYDGPAEERPLNVRALLTNSLGAAYPPEDLARDVLAGMEADQAFIVAPEPSAAFWGAYRNDPESILEAMGRQAIKSRERRSSH
jgi:NAD(P)-dependent dehydrogenase (short-subunit alcohol dehydrogenase family)